MCVDRYLVVYVFVCSFTYIWTFYYIDLSIYLYIYSFPFPPNKRSFRGPGGIIRELDLCYWAKICARELASVVSGGLQWSPGASRRRQDGQ